MKRIFVAALAAPFLPCVVIAASVTLLVMPFTDGRLTVAPLYGLSVASAFGIIGYAALLFLGTPTHILFRRRGWVGWYGHTCLGAFLGLVTSVLGQTATLALFSVSGVPDWSRRWLLASFLVGYGAAVGFGFWKIARPDKNTAYKAHGPELAS
jgi:hypothetical protein